MEKLRRGNERYCGVLDRTRNSAARAEEVDGTIGRRCRPETHSGESRRTVNEACCPSSGSLAGNTEDVAALDNPQSRLVERQLAASCLGALRAQGTLSVDPLPGGPPLATESTSWSKVHRAALIRSDFGARVERGRNAWNTEQLGS